MNTQNHLKLSAVIVAAGYSSRMHAFKPLLKLGEKTVLETTVSKFTEAGIEDIIVVLGHQSEALLPLVKTLGLKWVINPDYAKGMFTSIQAGVRAVEPNAAGFFMMPVDIPLVRSTTIEVLKANFDPDAMDVLYPTTEGKRGHPPLITKDLIPRLLTDEGTGGLKAFLNATAKRVSHLEVSDPGIHTDMDTEEAYMTIKALSGM